MTAAGRIYFIQAEGGGPIKIGFAGDVGERLKGLQVSHPTKLICLVHIAGTRDDEQLFHLDYQKFRLSGEWFEPSPEIMALVETAKGHPSACSEVPQPEEKKRPLSTRDRLSDAYAELFCVFAYALFGRIGTAKKLGMAANVSQVAAGKWLSKKGDPSMAAIINLCRREPSMRVWLAATVVGGVMSEEIGCTDEQAIACLFDFPDHILPLFLCDDPKERSEALQILWLQQTKPSADCLRYLEEFSRDSMATYEKRKFLETQNLYAGRT